MENSVSKKPKLNASKVFHLTLTQVEMVGSVTQTTIKLGTLAREFHLTPTQNTAVISFIVTMAIRKLEEGVSVTLMLWLTGLQKIGLLS